MPLKLWYRTIQIVSNISNQNKIRVFFGMLFHTLLCKLDTKGILLDALHVG